MSAFDLVMTISDDEHILIPEDEIRGFDVLDNGKSTFGVGRPNIKAASINLGLEVEGLGDPSGTNGSSELKKVQSQHLNCILNAAKHDQLTFLDKQALQARAELDRASHRPEADTDALEALIAMKREQLQQMSDSPSSSKGEQDDDDDDDLQTSSSDDDEDADAATAMGSKEPSHPESGNLDDDDDHDDHDHDNDNTDEENEGKSSFFAKAPKSMGAGCRSFRDFGLALPFLKAIQQVMLYDAPTRVQAKTIPLAMLGRDLCVCSETGSGKTAAFLLPALHQLFLKAGRHSAGTIKVLVMSPTRELAVQVHETLSKLVLFVGASKITHTLLVGGLSIHEQRLELSKALPDVLVATPGRLIDHLYNTKGFSLDAVEVLILDEADRLLELGFKDSLEELVNAMPHQRQTLLFSATQTDKVEDLVSLSLQNPVRIFISKNIDTAANLTQEFIHVDETRNDLRAAIVLALCKRYFKTKCIVFFNSKLSTHRMKIIFGLLGLRAAELHGNLSQAQRLSNLKDFKDGRVDFLLATDLAARGIDIDGIEVVINATLPANVKQYIHRVGRTARAGKAGRAISLVGETERQALKLVLKNAKRREKILQTNPSADIGAAEMTLGSKILSRTIDDAIIQRYSAKIAHINPTVREIIEAENSETLINEAERKLTRTQNMVRYSEELSARPKKSWFQTSKDKKAADELDGKACSIAMAQKENASSTDRELASSKIDIHSEEMKGKTLYNIKVVHQIEDKKDIKNFAHHTTTQTRSQRRGRQANAAMDPDELKKANAMQRQMKKELTRKNQPKRLVAYKNEDDDLSKRGLLEKKRRRLAKTPIGGRFKLKIDEADRDRLQAKALKVLARDAQKLKEKKDLEKKNRLKELRGHRGSNAFKSKSKYKRK